MQVDIAPAAGEGELLGGRDVLVADGDHQVVEQRRADFGQDLLRNVLRQVDAADFGAKRAGDLLDVEVTVLGVAWCVHGSGPPVLPKA